MSVSDELQVRLSARDELTGKLKQVSGAVKKATDELAKLSNDLESDAGRRAYDEARRSLGELSIEQKRLRTQIGKNERAIKDLASENHRSMSAMGRAVDRLKKKWDSSSDAVRKWSKRAGAGIAAAVGAAGAASIKLAGNFEQSQSILQGSSGASAKQMDALRKLAMDMGAKTSYSAQDASNAMVDLSKAGLSVKDIMGGGVQAAMSLAATEGIEMSTAANTAANAMAMFQLNAKDLPAIADALAGGSNASTASVSSLAQALSQVGPGAYNSGLTLTDTVGTLAALEQAGIKGSDAGTSLKTMLTRLVPMTSTAFRAMEGLGIVSYDSTTAMKKLGELGIKPLSSKYDDVRTAVAKYVVQTQGLVPGTKDAAKATDKMVRQLGFMRNAFIDSKGNFKDVTQVAQVLKDKLGGLTQEQKTAALAQVFGSDASRAAAILAREGAAGLEKFIRATQKKGAAEAMAAKRTKTFNGQMEAFRGSIETIGIELGLTLLPKLTAWAKWGTDKGIPMFKGIGKWINQNRGVILAVAGVIGGLVAVVKVTEGVTRAWTAATRVHMAVERVRLALSKDGLVVTKAQLIQTKVAAAATKVWAGVQAAFNAVMSANPVALVVIGIVAQIAIVVLAYKRVGWFRDGVNAAWRWIKRVTASFVGWFKGTALPALARVWTAIKAAAARFVDWFKGTAWPAIKVVIGYVIGYYRTLWKGVKVVWAGVRAAVSGFVGWFRETAWPAISRTITLAKAGFGAVWTKAKAVWKGVSDTVRGAVDRIKDIVSSIKGVFSGVWDGVSGAARAAFDGVRNAWNNTIGSFSVTIPDWVPAIGGKTWTGPRMQDGGVTFPGLRALVGEVGPELWVPTLGAPRVIGADGPEVVDFAAAGVVIPNHLMPQVPAPVVREREVVMVGAGGPAIQTGPIYAAAGVDVEAALIHAEMRRQRIANERRAGGGRQLAFR